MYFIFEKAKDYALEYGIIQPIMTIEKTYEINKILIQKCLFLNYFCNEELHEDNTIETFRNVMTGDYELTTNAILGLAAVGTAAIGCLTAYALLRKRDDSKGTTVVEPSTTNHAENKSIRGVSNGLKDRVKYFEDFRKVN